MTIIFIIFLTTNFVTRPWIAWFRWNDICWCIFCRSRAIIEIHPPWNRRWRWAPVCKSLNRYISAADCSISLIFRRIFVHGLCFAIDSAQAAAAAEPDDFPTPESLREANSGYKQGATEKDETGRVVPSPAVRTKQQIFRPSDYKSIDDRACQVLDTVVEAMDQWVNNGLIRA